MRMKGRLNVAVTPEAVAVIDRLAAARGRSRARQVRIMLGYALRHMPESWEPPQRPDVPRSRRRYRRYRDVRA